MMQIVSGERQIDRATFQAHVLSVAAGLKDMGVGEDDAVLILMRNDIEYLEASEAVTYLGAYVASLNWHGTADDMVYIATDCKAKAVIVHENLLPLLEKAPPMPTIVVPVSGHIAAEYGATANPAKPPAARDWRALIELPAIADQPKAPREPVVYTSGTTGAPKGVRRFPLTSSGQIEAMRATLGATFGLRDGMRTLVCSPLYHAAPSAYLRAAMAAMKTDGLVLIHPRFDPEKMLQAIQDYRIDRLWMVPTMFVALLKLPEETRLKYDVSSLRYIVHSAAPCPVEVKRKLIEWLGPIVYEFYGSTEVGPVTIAKPDDALAKPGTVGRINAHGEVVILGEDGTPAPAGEIGEIAAKNRSFPEFTYWNREAERRALDRGDLVATGDIGYFDQDGYLFLCDRKSHMIISGGANIYPAEIEAIVIEHPKVKDCAVFGVPDERFGEAVALAVETAPGAEISEAEIMAHLKGRIGAYKMPKLIQFHSSLPREDTGKIFKRILRQPFWEKTGRNI